MTDENSMPPSITSTTGFAGECNTSGLSSSTEQFIICCKVCGSLNGLRRCSRCKSVYYCSQVHQQVDWRVHKIECKKFANNLATSEYKCLGFSPFFSGGRCGSMLFSKLFGRMRFGENCVCFSVFDSTKIDLFFFSLKIQFMFCVFLMCIFVQKPIKFALFSLEQQSNESSNSTMTVETQQNHDRLLAAKNGVTNSVVSSSNANGVKKSSNTQPKDQDQYKRFTDNTMQVNVNLMENTLASR